MRIQFMGHVIQTQVDESVEPGHQVIMVGPADMDAKAILFTLTGVMQPSVVEIDGDDIHTWVAAPHDERADDRLIELLDLCADLRFAAPSLCQLQLSLDINL